RARSGYRGRPGEAARHLRQHPRPGVLRARGRRDEPDHVVAEVFPRRIPRPLRARRLPVRPASVDARRRHSSGRKRAMTAVSGAGAEKSETTDLVNVTIDDTEIAVPKGTLVIRAAELIGVQIPRFCDHPLLEPVGACPQCLVEVEGQRKPLASCTSVVTDGMVVRTQFTSPGADKAQRGVMELLLINHPLDCPVCDKGG